MKFFAIFSSIGNKIKKDYVSAFAAQCALFIIMSIVPILLLFMTIVRYTPLTQSQIIDFIASFAPTAFKSTLNSVVNQVYEQDNPILIAITIISVLWIAGKAFHSVIDGLNSVYDIPETRNDFMIRIYAIFYTILFTVMISICIILFVLGNTLISLFSKHIPFVANIMETIVIFRVLISLAIFTIFFATLYVVIPNRHSKFTRQIPGAFFAAVGWTGFTYFFSLYFEYSTNLTFLYGSLTNIVCAMLWLYVCMFIFLMGAEVNLFLEQWRMGKSIEMAADITHTDNTTSVEAAQTTQDNENQ